MSTDAQKKKLRTGMSSRAARERLRQIWQERNPPFSLNHVNKELMAQYGVGIFAVCEIWHRLRSTNDAFEFAIQAFAEKVSRLHQEKRHLEQVIVAQKAELSKRQGYCGIPKTAVEAEVRQVRESERL